MDIGSQEKGQQNKGGHTLLIKRNEGAGISMKVTKRGKVEKVMVPMATVDTRMDSKMDHQ